jgi:hypothetical protein
MELYICVMVVLSIVVGIPTAIKSMEFVLMYKFCRKFNEDENAYTGGVTICEALTNLFSPRKPVEDAPEAAQPEGEVAIGIDDLVEDEYLDTEAAVKFEEVIVSKPKNKCVVCCRAVFCCKAQNTVSREMELA